MDADRPCCPVCDGSTLQRFAEVRQVPVQCNIQWPDRESALAAPRGDILLDFCGACGHVFNGAFDPDLVEYSRGYENSLCYSPRFQSWAESLAKHLIEKYDVRGKTVVDIGCGRGDFLGLLCRLGANRGYGFDPGAESGTSVASLPEVEIIRDFYSQRHLGIRAHLFCCRHVLEHIGRPGILLGTLGQAVSAGEDACLYLEVPDVAWTLRHSGIWDLIYEHPSYFSQSSLREALSRARLDLLDLRSVYQGQFLAAEAAAGRSASAPPLPAREKPSVLAEEVSGFARLLQGKVRRWQEWRECASGTDKKTVVWGGGSKGVTFLNLVDKGGAINYVVDVNPHKQGRFIAGTGQQIVGPAFLAEYRPDQVVLMNAIYRDEVTSELDRLGLRPEVLAV